MIISPPKTANFGGENCSWSLKKISSQEMGVPCSFCKKMEKFRQIWPQQPLKHFTAAYRGFPPCTQSQYQQRDGVQQCTSIACADIHLIKPLLYSTQRSIHLFQKKNVSNFESIKKLLPLNSPFKVARKC